MDKRTTGIIATIATGLLCGVPGLFALCFGVIAAAVSQIQGAEIDLGGSNDPMTALFLGVGVICVGIIFIAIPIAVGFFTLRKREPASEFSDEPIPPPN